MIKQLLLSSAIISSFSLSAQTYIMNNSTITTCSGTSLDPGGAGNYLDNQNFVQTFCSGTTNCVRITFNSFDLESGYDYLAIYDGPGTSSTPVAGSPFTGSLAPFSVTCSSGCLTLAFSSDVSITASGWNGTITCVACPPPPPPPSLAYGWAQRASVPAIGRHRGVAISIGSRGYAGMGHINAITDILYDDWWEYDPGTNSWTQKASFPPGPRMHPTGFTVGNYGYIGTGRDNAYVERTDLYRYDPATNTWTLMAPLPGPARRGAVAFATGGKGYLGTGTYLNDFYCYDPASNSWTSIAPLPASGRIAAVAFAIGSKGYVATGNVGGPTGDIYEYDPATNVWTPRANMPGLPRMEAAAFSIKGKGYVGTGCNFESGTNYQDFWEFDPIANNWTQITDFSGSARRYMNAFAIGNKGYGVFGTSGTNYNDLWEYGNFVGADVEELDVKDLVKTFPNPFTDQITFSVSGEVQFGNSARIMIYDISGKLVREIRNINTYEIRMERDELKKGLYFYQFENDNKRSNGKFIAL